MDTRIKLDARELMELCLPKLLTETSKHRIPVIFSIGRSYPGKVELLYNLYRGHFMSQELKSQILRTEMHVLGEYFEYAEPGNWDLFKLLPNLERNGIDLRKENLILCNIKLKSKNQKS